jgi:hypothetical protein
MRQALAAELDGQRQRAPACLAELAVRVLEALRRATDPSAARVQPCASPLALRGASTSDAKRPDSSITASTMSGVTLSKPGRLP